VLRQSARRGGHRLEFAGASARADARPARLHNGRDVAPQHNGSLKLWPRPTASPCGGRRPNPPGNRDPPQVRPSSRGKPLHVPPASMISSFERNEIFQRDRVSPRSFLARITFGSAAFPVLAAAQQRYGRINSPGAKSKIQIYDLFLKNRAPADFRRDSFPPASTADGPLQRKTSRPLRPLSSLAPSARCAIASASGPCSDRSISAITSFPGFRWPEHLAQPTPPARFAPAGPTVPRRRGRPAQDTAGAPALQDDSPPLAAKRLGLIPMSSRRAHRFGGTPAWKRARPIAPGQRGL